MCNSPGGDKEPSKPVPLISMVSWQSCMKEATTHKKKIAACLQFSVAQTGQKTTGMCSVDQEVELLWLDR